MAAPLFVCNASVAGTANSLEAGQFWDEEKTRPMSYTQPLEGMASATS
jgi:hypothetical protein